MTGIMIGIILLAGAWLDDPSPDQSDLLEHVHALASQDPWAITFLAALFMIAGFLDLKWQRDDR